MLTALASQPRDSGPQTREWDTALTTAAGLSSGDYARWRLLASQGPFSGPFVDPHWILSWTEAFAPQEDRKSTRLNSSHSQISYAVFCLKKKRRSLVAVVCEHAQGPSASSHPS